VKNVWTAARWWTIMPSSFGISYVFRDFTSCMYSRFCAFIRTVFRKKHSPLFSCMTLRDVIRFVSQSVSVSSLETICLTTAKR